MLFEYSWPMSRELVYNILKFVLSSDKSDYDVFTGVDAEQWHWAFGVC